MKPRLLRGDLACQQLRNTRSEPGMQQPGLHCAGSTHSFRNAVITVAPSRM